jgi:hypothetical protein
VWRIHSGENREDTYRVVLSFDDGIRTKVGSWSYNETFKNAFGFAELNIGLWGENIWWGRPWRIKMGESSALFR